MILPGDVLATIEEYIAGEGTYVDPQGHIRSSGVGISHIEGSVRVISVKAKRRWREVPVGSSVLAIVSSIRHDSVVAEIYGVLQLGSSPKWRYELESPRTALLPISQITGEYVKDIYDHYRVGDIILAKVVNAIPPYHLTTKTPQYGVIYAHCSKCMSIMEPISSKSMRCPACGNVEQRKVSILASTKMIHIGIRRMVVQKRW